MDRYDPYTDKFIRDTIDRTDAIDALCKNGLEKERSGQLVMAMCEAKQWAIDTIEQLPSAQPAFDARDTQYNLPIGTDCISRQAAIDAAIEAADDWDGGCNIGRQKRIEKYIKQLPSAQPDIYWKEQCQSYERTINKLRESLSAKSETFEWCTDCKEYDQEAHCCHRWSKMIRKTIEEMQIVHCIDCQYSEYDSVYGERWCHYNGKAEVVDDYHFCRDGERRTE